MDVLPASMSGHHVSAWRWALALGPMRSCLYSSTLSHFSTPCISLKSGCSYAVVQMWKSEILFTMEVPEIKLWSSGLATGDFTCRTISLATNFFKSYIVSYCLLSGSWGMKSPGLHCHARLGSDSCLALSPPWAHLSLKGSQGLWFIHNQSIVEGQPAVVLQRLLPYS